MNNTYMVMDDKHYLHEGNRTDSIWGRGDYYCLGEQGVKILKERTYSEAARAYIENNAERIATWHFAYNMVCLVKMKCGHFDIFQHHVHSAEEAEAVAAHLTEEAKSMICADCMPF